MPSANPLEHIMYVSIPEQAVRTIGSFAVDPEILIPIEIVGGNESWTIENLSWEMIIAAMLKVLVHDPKNPHQAYYRNFVLAARPEVVQELSATGIEQAERKNFEVAEEVFAALRALTPQDPVSALNLALMYEERSAAYEQANRGDLADEYRNAAFSLYSELSTRFPDDPQVRFNCGHFFLRIKNYERARDHFGRFLELSDDGKKIKIVRAVLTEIDRQSSTDELFQEAYDFILMGRERDGIDRINRFLEIHPNVWNAWFLLGWGYRRLEQYQPAREAFNTALSLEPHETDTLNELAICQMELGEFDDCESTLTRALSTDPENAKIISNLAILSLKRGEIERAKAYFRTVLEFDPDDVIARNYLEYLRES